MLETTTIITCSAVSNSFGYCDYFRSAVALFSLKSLCRVLLLLCFSIKSYSKILTIVIVVAYAQSVLMFKNDHEVRGSYTHRFEDFLATCFEFIEFYLNAKRYVHGEDFSQYIFQWQPLCCILPVRCACDALLSVL